MSNKKRTKEKAIELEKYNTMSTIDHLLYSVEVYLVTFN